jgi:hypothetical protein
LDSFLEGCGGQPKSFKTGMDIGYFRVGFVQHDVDSMEVTELGFRFLYLICG